MTFRSPSGTAAIEIWQTRIANEYGTRIKLVTAQKRTDIFENRREALVYFVHVYWTPDETKVGVMMSGLNLFHLAFDAQTGHQLPFEQIRKDFADSIRKSYDVPPGEDPIGWAAGGDAAEAFRRLHPEIRPSYF